MKSKINSLAALILLTFSGIVSAPCMPQTSSTPATPHSFRVENGKYLLDGKPFQIIAGEMHYARIPREYWRARLRMAKAMGLNTITTYVFWNFHEPRPGEYDFTGRHDVAEFVREAQSEGLYVNLRPGPYSCAEWEWGGFPSWLLKDHGIVVRSTDPRFMTPAREWLLRLGQELAPLQVGNGGPIISVQVENEYGSFGNDHAYMEQIHRDLVDAGFDKALLYTADGPEEIPNGSLPELPAGINFSPGEAPQAFATLHKLRPEGPFMATEWWDGWFDHWGEHHHTTDAKAQAKELEWILEQGYSISIYMFHGGTSFGWMNGANWDNSHYEPDVTSYDYDSALDESGRPSPKFYLFRDAIAKATGVTPPPIPDIPPPISVPPAELTQSVSLWRTLPQPVASEQLETMEDLDQAYGYILYRTTVAGPVAGDLVLDQVHDYALIYANGKLLGTLDRRLDQNKLHVDLTEPSTRLDILVENSGRINFSLAIRGERQGITKQVTLAGRPLTGWQIYSLPMDDPGKLPFGSGDCTGPCFYRGTLKVDKPGDTFLDTSNFTKGFVWVNGHPLGRIWNVGPQKTLYLPGVWLYAGNNDVIVFDLEGKPGRTVEGRPAPILDSTAAH
ncbi:MAG TPA: glycoside hydrolase family 35 protein [Terracidiphilus sp.]|nr:glycoside hydrolase family 35 protein [Terracidiphilus sp.]